MATFTTKPDGTIDLADNQISRFSIRDISQVSDYSIENQGGVITHRFSFSGGGSVHLEFDTVAGRYSLDTKAVKHTLQEDPEQPGFTILSFAKAG